MGGRGTGESNHSFQCKGLANLKKKLIGGKEVFRFEEGKLEKAKSSFNWKRKDRGKEIGAVLEEGRTRAVKKKKLPSRVTLEQKEKTT